MLPVSYVDMIQKNLVKIDFVESRKLIQDKLGGELDYKEYQHDIDSIMEELRQENESFDLLIQESDIIIPDLGENYAEEYIKNINNTPSILEDLKSRIQRFKQSIPIYENEIRSPQDNLGSLNMAQQAKVARGNTPKPEANQLYWNRHSSSKNKETTPVPQQKAKNGVSGLPTQNTQKK